MNKEKSFQERVWTWLKDCFGNTISESPQERNHRFIEEALELVQACGCTKEECHRIVDYVFSREVGVKCQETGGVIICLAALSEVHGIDMIEAGENELKRVWTKIEKIREKQRAKPYMGNKPYES